mmetsp:Transcript_23973/g.35987  ORF Transcript_23973/g.35987 Transcript_23973/m.35987 type:complete len:141 (-) Transcript_23973:14-436(-)
MRVFAVLSSIAAVQAFTFVPADTYRQQQQSRSSSELYVDNNVIMGAGIAFAGLAAGIGLVTFTENQGERGKERGSGLSDRMATNIAGGLLEDVEVSTVSDLGSLTSQLEAALKNSGADAGNTELTEEEKQKKIEELDDGW